MSPFILSVVQTGCLLAGSFPLNHLPRGRRSGQFVFYSWLLCSIPGVSCMIFADCRVALVHTCSQHYVLFSLRRCLNDLILELTCVLPRLAHPDVKLWAHDLCQSWLDQPDGNFKDLLLIRSHKLLAFLNSSQGKNASCGAATLVKWLYDDITAWSTCSCSRQHERLYFGLVRSL